MNSALKLFCSQWHKKHCRIILAFMVVVHKVPQTLQSESEKVVQFGAVLSNVKPVMISHLKNKIVNLKASLDSSAVCTLNTF